MAKASDNDFPSLLLSENAAKPDAPAANHWRIYMKDDNKLYREDSAGAETEVGGGGAGSDTTAIHDNVAGEIAAVAEKASPIAADMIIVEDSEDSDNKKMVQVGNLPVVGAAASGWIAMPALTYAGADAPSFTFTAAGDVSGTYSVGMRVKLTQATGGTKYFIITKLAVSGDTTFTVYGGTDYTLNDEAISNPYYSTSKIPQGFPLDPTKWMVTTTDTSSRSQATPSANTWYNLGTISISIPIGVWHVSYQVAPRLTDATTDSPWEVKTTLSTANNSESDVDFTATLMGNEILSIKASLYREKVLVLASKTAYYLNTMTTGTNVDTIYNRNASSKLIIRAICAYL